MFNQNRYDYGSLTSSINGGVPLGSVSVMGEGSRSGHGKLSRSSFVLFGLYAMALVSPVILFSL